MSQADKFSSYIKAVISIALLLVFDQLTKVWAINSLKGQDSIILINKVFQLYYIENHGAAFGIMQNKKLFFIVMAFAIIVVLSYIYSHLPFSRKFTPLRILFVFICAGALGNMIDRFRYEYVVDFFYFNLIDFPIFNVADIYITVSTIVLILLILFYYKEEDFEGIFQRRK